MAPDVTVVVPTHNRSSLLPSLVDALLSQQDVEADVVIVDDGSTDGTADLLRRQAVGSDGRLRVLRITNGGPARARNTGWREGRGRLVAFTDDDCVPAPTWLAELVGAAARADIVQGRTEPLHQPDVAPGWFDRSPRIDRWSGRFETCNLLISRAVLEQLGGFDESFPAPMGEDTDLGFRAVAAGATTTFAERALVHHRVWTTGFGAFLRHRRRHTEVVRLVRVNPAARSILHWRFAVRRLHVPITGLVPLTIWSVWRGVPWLPIVPVAGWCAWNTFRTRSRPFPAHHRFAYSAAQFTGYAYETWCFAVASVRHRTLVL